MNYKLGLQLNQCYCGIILKFKQDFTESYSQQCGAEIIPDLFLITTIGS